MLEGDRLFLKLKFFVKFCILMFFHLLLNYGKNFQFEAQDMKIGLF